MNLGRAVGTSLVWLLQFVMEVTLLVGFGCFRAIHTPISQILSWRVQDCDQLSPRSSYGPRRQSYVPQTLPTPQPARRGEYSPHLWRSCDRRVFATTTPPRPSPPLPLPLPLPCVRCVLFSSRLGICHLFGALVLFLTNTLQPNPSNIYRNSATQRWRSRSP